MKFSKRRKIINTLLLLLITILLTVLLKSQECSGSTYSTYSIWKISIGSKYHSEITKYCIPLQDIKLVSAPEMLPQIDFAAQNTTQRTHVIKIPIMCSESNCHEFLSKEERKVVTACKRLDIDKEQLDISFHGHNCSFLPEMGRHPVALVSAAGSGNTWTRGLLERATGVCTGSVGCDNILKSHGFVGEDVKSGKVLVVKTHLVTPKWVHGSHRSGKGADHGYSAAVFILRNPVMSVIAEWNRRASRRILGKNNSAISYESHTYLLPRKFFGKESVQICVYTFAITYVFYRWGALGQLPP